MPRTRKMSTENPIDVDCFLEDVKGHSVCSSVGIYSRQHSSSLWGKQNSFCGVACCSIVGPNL